MASDQEFAISVRNLSKCYEIYDRPAHRLMQTLFRGRRRFYREFWALRDVSFDLGPGETLGVVGRNGSGKSTLLQILAGTLRPTEGEVTVRGRVHALLELGSGFNPDFTGRENVYLNGAVLGLPSRAIDARFDDIARFADIGQFLNQPVKTYSTGMVVRLAFAVQALLEPDVLIVDEALAVGDAAFQVKCVHHMRRLIARGTSVILVTHDVGSVRQFCERVLWLHDGRAMMDGPPGPVTSRYVQFLFDQQHVALEAEDVPADSQPSSQTKDGNTLVDETARTLAAVKERPDLVRWGSGELQVQGVALDNGTPGNVRFEHGGQLLLEFSVTATRAVASGATSLAFSIRTTKGLDLIAYTSWEAGERMSGWGAGETRRMRFVLPNILAQGEYAVALAVEDVRGGARHYFDFVENAVVFRVSAGQPIFSAVLPPVRHERVPVGGAAEDGA